MSASPFVRTEVRPDRSSDAPIAVDIGGVETARRNRTAGWASRIPQSWIGMSGYLVAGVLLGLVLIVALGITRSESGKTAAAGESPAMRACIESHVKSWEFLPQANPSQMVLPFEIDPR